ncbi:hypothetical protein OPV22_002345 [Ensete ventricosum]|uniref:Uncharacterized protein n=1 Tax=Ensete ventricosum TaxID=4639 RepID=A0AAV8RXR8_ENSVE|nr:hypothetical protein OPV22_002345 [Ensete ventricosum]
MGAEPQRAEKQEKGNGNREGDGKDVQRAEKQEKGKWKQGRRWELTPESLFILSVRLEVPESQSIEYTTVFYVHHSVQNQWRDIECFRRTC